MNEERACSKYLLFHSQDPLSFNNSLLLSTIFCAYGRYNRGEYDRNMDPDMRKRLEDFFRPCNEELYDYIGRSFDG